MEIRNREALERGNRRRAHAIEIVEAGITAVLPENAVRNAVKADSAALTVDGRRYDLDRYRHVYVAGGGKAAATMAEELERLLGDRITAGIVNDRYAAKARPKTIRVNPAGHPLPTADGVRGVRDMTGLLARAGPEDLVVFLVSGGGSALLPCPVEGISLEDTIALTDLLLKSGATIAEMNTVRKHVSAIKGGQLLCWTGGAEVLSLLVSDVVGDDPGSIASGPTAPDPTTFADARAILKRYGLWDRVPASIRHHLTEGERGLVPETLKPGDPAFDRVANVVIAGNGAALAAAAEKATRLGYVPVVLGSHIKGESRDVGLVHAGIGIECLATGHPARPPAAILSGGETTVTVRGQGRGGRNQEFVLGFLREYRDGLTVVAVDTDGIDGATEACGAIADESTLPRAGKLGLSPEKALAANASRDFFEALGDLVYTGPTGTNVSDLRVVLAYEFDRD